MMRGATALPLTPSDRTQILRALSRRCARFGVAFDRGESAPLLAALLWEMVLARLGAGADAHPSEGPRIDALLRCFSNDERFDCALARWERRLPLRRPLSGRDVGELLRRWLALVERARSPAHLFALLCDDPALALCLCPARDPGSFGPRLERARIKALAPPLWGLFHGRLLSQQIEQLGRLGRALFDSWRSGFAFGGRTGPAFPPLPDGFVRRPLFSEEREAPDVARAPP